MRKVRVLVAEDSLTIRKYLLELLEADPGIEIVGEAANGREACELCQRLRPDVVTLDMMMPEMNGLQATEHIMAHCPTPILIVSASTNRGELFRTFDALRAGAVDVIEKPLSRGAHDGAWARKLTDAVKMTARIRVITHPRGRLGAYGREAGVTAGAAVHTASVTAPGPTVSGRRAVQAVAIGASTGGPAAVLRVLQGLPRDFPVPILLVIHISTTFGLALADWLASQSSLPVSYPEDGQVLQAEPRVWMATPDRHMIVERGRIRLTDTAERHACRPSVDVLFESLAKDMAAACVACLLTGMGKDGAAGLLAIHRAGGVTMAQDEASSVVYGMPREAALLGAAQRVLPLAEIAPTLCTLTGSHLQSTSARPNLSFS